MSRVCLVIGCMMAIFSAACGGGSSGHPTESVATHFSVVSPATSNAGVAFTVTVTALSASNATVTNYSGTIHFTSSDAGAVLPGDSHLINGTGSFAVTLFTPPTQTITTTDTVTATIAGVSSLVTVSALQSSLINMSSPRELHTATLLNDGTVLVVCGDDGNAPLATAEIFDNTANTFAATGSLAAARRECTATLLPNGKVLITGGFDASGAALASAELYDPATKTFGPAGNMSIARAEHTATLLKNGKVVIIGGQQDFSSSAATASAELFDPVAGTFSRTGAMADARRSHTAALLSDGTVLVSGGIDEGGELLASAEIFDPVAGTFATTGNLISPRAAFTAALLANGKVLVAGGSAVTSTYSSAELFDPVAGSFSNAGLMSVERESHTATSLTNGMVLEAGGDQYIFVGGGSTRAGSLPESNASTELFDPGSNIFSAGTALLESRSRHTTTLLSDGRILVTGGRHSTITNTNVPLSSVLHDAELLH
jgi:hypothetical protein